MSELLSQVDWLFINSLDIDDACLHFHETTSVIGVVSPEINVKIPANQVRREAWDTKGLMKSSKTLSKLYRKKGKYPPEHQSSLNYVKFKNLYNIFKKIAIKNHTTLNFYKIARTMLKRLGILSDHLSANKKKRPKYF